MVQGVPKESETCPVCGDDFDQLEAHFRGITTCDPPDGYFDDMAKAHDLSNLEVLCADCHGV